MIPADQISVNKSIPNPYFAYGKSPVFLVPIFDNYYTLCGKVAANSNYETL